MSHTDPTSSREALDLLRRLGAPPRLIQHGEIVSEVAAELSNTLSRFGVKHDEQIVTIGAALHDAGKIVHPEELTGPGSRHEVAGENLLSKYGVSTRLARVCRAHGSWDREPVSLEEGLIALADHLWKGTRGEQIEELVVAQTEAKLGLEDWETLILLDPEFERIAAGAAPRLSRAR